MAIKSDPNQVQSDGRNLVALALEAAEIARLLAESEGELSPDLEKRLDINTTQLLEKVDAYKFVMDEFESQASLWKARKQACDAIEKRFASQVDRMKDRIRVAMKEMGETEISGEFYRFQLRKGRPKLVIDDEDKIPPDFKMVVQTTVIDKEKLTAALGDGFDVPGVHQEENGSLYPLPIAGKKK